MLYSRKLTEYCKPAMMEKIKIIKKRCKFMIEDTEAKYFVNQVKMAHLTVFLHRLNDFIYLISEIYGRIITLQIRFLSLQK